MEFKDYYKILGVESSASEDDIRRAYRKLARKYHPDVSKEADTETRMREVNEAYDVLRDKEKRQAYDNLAAGVSPDGGFEPPPGWDQGFEFHYQPGEGDGDGRFSGFFSALFGGQQRNRARQENFRARGQDQHAAIEVDIDDALGGATREISLRSMQADAQGQPQIHTRTLSVNIPAGVREGQFIRLTGQGMPGYGGGEAGDLYLEIRFRAHDRYRAEGRDLYMELPITPGKPRWALPSRSLRRVASWKCLCPPVRKVAASCGCAAAESQAIRRAISIWCLSWRCRLPTRRRHARPIKRWLNNCRSIRVAIWGFEDEIRHHHAHHRHLPY
ncbi:dnaJ C terminal domain protein [Bordetella holmesii 44057]|nr:dnaJ C terminal domain protein [Bordetella holmesii 44057]